MAFQDISIQTTITASLVTILVATLFVWLAARFVLDRSSLLASLATVVLGTLLAGFLAGLVDGILGVVLAAAAWALVAALFFRTEWIKGAIIGLVAWALWAITLWATDALL